MTARPTTREMPGRRGFLAALASLPLVGATSVAFFAKRADAATTAILQQIDEAELRCHETSQAFADGIQRFEQNLPRMHPHLDLTGRDPIYRSAPVERGFDSMPGNRRGDHAGRRGHRFIGTADFFRRELEGNPDAYGRRYFRRMIRRAERYEAATARVIEDLGLEKMRCAKEAALRRLEELGEAVFAAPATTYAAARVQAHIICAYAAVKGETHSAWRVATWGKHLAENVRDMGSAA